MHQIRGPRVLAFLAVHRADQAEVVHRLGDLRQVLGDLDAGDGRLDRLRLAAVGMARLGIEGFELARAALHPEEDAGLAAFAQVGRIGSQQVLPAQHAGRRGSGGNGFEKIAAADLAAADGDGGLEVDGVGHGMVQRLACHECRVRLQRTPTYERCKNSARVDEAPEDVFERFGAVVDLLDELQARGQLALARLRGQARADNSSWTRACRP